MRPDADLVSLDRQMLLLFHSMGDTGELTPETEAALESLEGELPHRVEAVCRVIAAFNQREAGLRKEEERFRLAAQRSAKAAELLRERLTKILQQLGVVTADGQTYRVRLKKSPPSVTVTDEALSVLPDSFVVTSRRPNSRLILHAVQAGHPMPDGVDVVQDEHVEIRVT